MRENIIILSQNTHSFLHNEIIYASNVFQRVIVVCPPSIEIKKITNDLLNVEILFYSKKDLYKYAITSLPCILEKDKRAELKKSIHNKTISLKYLKHYFNFLAMEKLFEILLKDKLQLTDEEAENWIFYSAWYYVTAYAVTQAKLKYKNAKVISLAHSFEVDKIKFPYIRGLFRNIYHNRLDELSFISQNVYRIFKKDIAKPLNLSLDNVYVKYLGTRKLFKGVNKPSTDGILRVVSCSNIIPVKRVDLIFHTLDKFESLPIEWTHFGSGDQMDYLKELIKHKNNKNLKVNLLGKVENIKIHKYYVENPVDLFINTSVSEGIPVSIMEAIAYGIPVVATDVGGNSEIVKEEFGRLICKDPTVEEIKEAILSIVMLSNQEKLEMRQNAIEFFINNFDADNIRKEFFQKLKNE